MSVRVALAQWGNNLALRLPKAVAQQLGVAPGSEVNVTVADGALVAAPVRRRPKLDELVKRINDKNRHAATDWGTPVGREVW
jgi:antitoxin MazE